VADLKGQEIRDAYDYLLTKGSGTAIEDGDGNAFIGAIVDNLTSTSTTAPLSANQGKVLNDTTVKLTGNQSVAGVKTLTDIVRATAGINFNASGGDTLDDYEVGTFTPIYTTSGNDFDSITYNRQVGFYIRIGKLYYTAITLRTSTVTIGSASGTLAIGGLPATAKSDNLERYGAHINFADAWSANNTPSSVNMSADFAQLIKRSTSDGSSSTINATDLATGNNANSLFMNITFISI
jgi:hypothetical protein